MDSILITLSLLLRDLGFVMYGGSIFAFTTLIALAQRDVIPYVRLEEAVRVYRAWGPGLGLSMGAIVFGALAHHFLTTGGFTWPLSAASTPAWAIFFCAWVSNLRLEVWTLDPVRKLDDGQGITDRSAYETAVRWLVAHLASQTLLIFGASLLFFLAEHR